MPHKTLELAGKPYHPSDMIETIVFVEYHCCKCKYDRGGGCGYGIVSQVMLFDVDEEGYPPEWVHDDEGRPVCTKFEETADDR